MVPQLFFSDTTSSVYTAFAGREIHSSPQVLTCSQSDFQFWIRSRSFRVELTTVEKVTATNGMMCNEQCGPKRAIQFDSIPV